MPTVAYLGPEKTNTHFAALQHFGRGAKTIHAPTIDQVFHMVERREADYGVVPIENSLGGAVTRTLDRFIDFIDTPVQVHGEIDLPIRHFLMMRRGSNLREIGVVYSHPQALEQCARWLETHLPRASRSETDSTAEAVQRLLHNRIGLWSTSWKMKERAAIGPKELVEEYKLKSVPIPQDRENRTRFLILGLGHRPLKRPSKTSLLLVLKDKSGALHDALVPFKRYGINLTKIESRPSRRKVWEYIFFIDCEGHESDPKVRSALGALRRCTSECRVLGSYPTGGRGGRG